MAREADLRVVLARAAQKSLDGIGPDDDLMERLGLDSLAGLRMLAAVEKHFAVRFPDERLHELRTLRRILAHIDPPGEAKP